MIHGACVDWVGEVLYTSALLFIYLSHSVTLGTGRIRNHKDPNSFT